jgi:two-component system response regulator AtoC
MINARQLPPHTLKETKILVIDDEEILAWSIDTELKSLGAEVMRAGSVREALERFILFGPDVVVTDLRLPDGNGLELLKKWRVEHPDIPIILITAHGAIDSAVTALRLGAFDYLQKPFDMKDLIAAVRRAAETGKLRQKVSGFQGVEARHTEVEMIGNSPEMAVLRDQLLRIAKSKANTALILGDSGTGKELAARAIHSWSDRANWPFVEINCASIPDTLLESELFGYERGAFTDARERKIGLFEIAKNGTIFLDEIGEMPLKLQAKMLRALEYRRFKRLGGVKDIEFSARIVAATHRNLRKEVFEQRFREDLFYRLNVLPVKIPRLCERVNDIPLLVEYFVERLSQELEMTRPQIARGTMEKLMSYHWPGNIRELKNVLQRALVFFEPTLLVPEHIDLEIGAHDFLPWGTSGQGVETSVRKQESMEGGGSGSGLSSSQQQADYQREQALNYYQQGKVTGASGVREQEMQQAPGLAPRDLQQAKELSGLGLGGASGAENPHLAAGAGVASGGRMDAVGQVHGTPDHARDIPPGGVSSSLKVPSGLAGSAGGAAFSEVLPWSGLNDAGVVLPGQGLNLDDLEKSLMIQALHRCKHNQTKAALLLGISRHTLRYRLEKHGLLQPGSPGSKSQLDSGDGTSPNEQEESESSAEAATEGH